MCGVVERMVAECRRRLHRTERSHPHSLFASQFIIIINHYYHYICAMSLCLRTPQLLFITLDRNRQNRSLDAEYFIPIQQWILWIALFVFVWREGLWDSRFGLQSELPPRNKKRHDIVWVEIAALLSHQPGGIGSRSKRHLFQFRYIHVIIRIQVCTFVIGPRWCIICSKNCTLCRLSLCYYNIARKRKHRHEMEFIRQS